MGSPESHKTIPFPPFQEFIREMSAECMRWKTYDRKRLELDAHYRRYCGAWLGQVPALLARPLFRKRQWKIGTRKCCGP